MRFNTIAVVIITNVNQLTLIKLEDGQQLTLDFEITNDVQETTNVNFPNDVFSNEQTGKLIKTK